MGMAKNYFITVRVTEREKNDLKKAAETLKFRTLSAYIRRKLFLGGR
jgi:hypothetical protein